MQIQQPWKKKKEKTKGYKPPQFNTLTCIPKEQDAE